MMPRPNRASPEYTAALRSSVRWDPERQKPYIQLPSFPDIRIVPLWEGMEDALVRLFNNESIGKRLYTLPYPYPRSYAESTLTRVIPLQRAIAASLVLPPHFRSSLSSAPPPTPDPSSTPSPTSSIDLALPPQPAPIPELPFKSIVRLLPDGTRQVIGDSHLGAGLVLLPPGSELAERQMKRPEERGEQVFRVPVRLGRGVVGVGEPVGAGEGEAVDQDYELLTPLPDDARASDYPPSDQVFALGYVLDPAWEGRGIMSEVVGCLVQGWARGFMGARLVAAYVEVDNPGSVGVLQKNGFAQIGVEHTPWPEHKGGGVRDCWCYVVRL